jgi:hypothetical protein
MDRFGGRRHLTRRCIQYQVIMKVDRFSDLEKVKLSLCLIEHNVMKAPPFLTSALDVVERLVLLHVCFTPGERAPSTNFLGGWGGPRAGGPCG